MYKILLALFGAAMGTVVGIISRPSVAGTQVPLSLLSSNDPADQLLRDQLLSNIIFCAIVGLIVGATVGYIAGFFMPKPVRETAQRSPVVIRNTSFERKDVPNLREVAPLPVPAPRPAPPAPPPPPAVTVQNPAVLAVARPTPPAVATAGPGVPKRSYDEGKWASLLEIDPEISEAAIRLRTMGQSYEDEFAERYLTFCDRYYLRTIVDLVEARAAGGQQPG